MKTKLKAILLTIAFLILALALMSLADEAARSDDYFYVRTGWVSEPVLFESEGK